MQNEKLSLTSEQIKLEEKYATRGAMQYTEQVKNAPAGSSDYAKILYKKYLEPFTRIIEEYPVMYPNRFKDIFRLVKDIDAKNIAYIVLHTTIDSIVGNDRCTLISLSAKIAKNLHTEILIKEFKKQNPLYLKQVDKSLKQSQSQDTEHKAKVALYTANKMNISYVEWTNREKTLIGSFFAMLLINNFEIAETQIRIFNAKKIKYVNCRKEFAEWIDKQIESIAKFKICKPLCVVPPKDWTAFDDGGYYTPEQQVGTKFITAPCRHWKEYRKHFTKMPKVVRAVNALQKTAWHINGDMLDIAKKCWENGYKALPNKDPFEVPEFEYAKDKKKADMTDDEKEKLREWKNEARIIYTAEKKRLGKALAVVRMFSIAEDFRNYDKVYFVYNVDFRGRIYSASYGVSPQGADYSKALLEFAEGVQLTERGIYWLKVHTANCYGVDKVPFEDRVKWVDDNMELIIDCAKNPTDNTNWVDADKPFQFLRACLEWYSLKRLGSSHRSKLPIGVDGSCNGLQNFSALLRDPIGGMATNLVPTNTPQDIYQVVANKVIKKLQEDKNHAELANSLLDFGITRKLAKKPVMTLPYGSTKLTCFKSIWEYLEEKGFSGDVKKAAMYLRPLLWDSIGDTVIAAREAMDWLKKAAYTLSKANVPIVWKTPLNFLCIQDKRTLISGSVEVWLYGRVRVTFTNDAPAMDVIKNKDGISPNFIHSMDATHLMMTINKCLDNNITQFHCVHDDYGTYANDIDKLNILLRQAFIELYNNYDMLSSIYNYYKSIDIILPDIPNKGTLNINNIINSKYFFC